MTPNGVKIQCDVRKSMICVLHCLHFCEFRYNPDFMGRYAFDPFLLVISYLHLSNLALFHKTLPLLQKYKFATENLVVLVLCAQKAILVLQLNLS